jgi:hypothetical protein
LSDSNYQTGKTLGLFRPGDSSDEVPYYTHHMTYLESRKSFAREIGRPELFEFIDHWQLYVGQENLSRFLTIYEVLREIQNVPGDIAELGSWQGANLLGMAKALRHLNPDSAKSIYSFDSFQGLTNPALEDNFDEDLRGKYRGDFDKLCAAILLYNFENQVFLKRGMIENTVPRFAEENSNRNLSLIYYDADFFEPAETMFEYLAPMLSVGGIILLDEYGTPQWPGETKSADKFLSLHKNFVGEKIVTSKQPTLRITRIS